ncbi:MAG TPA: DMT family transporter [Anaerolineaceae bacterium]|nr:DMT family transporter [Anaerolineaceae bacterium]
MGILAVSTASVLIRFAQTEASSIVIAAYRLGLAALILAVMVLPRQWAAIRALPRRTLALAALAGFFLAFHFASWITSLEHTTIASSVVLVTTAPLWVAMLSGLVLHERIAPAVWLGLGVALLGGVIVGVSGECTLTSGQIACPPLSYFASGKNTLGNLLALFGAWMSGAYLMVGRKVRPQLSLGTYVFLVYGTAAIVLVILALISGQPFTGFSPQTYLWLVGLALIPQLLGHSAFNWALRYLPAAYVSVALLGEPVGTVILAFLLLREFPTPLELFGGLLILVGIALASRVSTAPTQSPAKIKTGDH